MDPRSVMVSLRTWNSLTRPTYGIMCVSSFESCTTAIGDVPRMTTPVTLSGSVGDLIWAWAEQRQSVSTGTMHEPTHIVVVLC